jgi:protein-L-isoaspartate(D-aspartate) O-methyltransferase
MLLSGRELCLKGGKNRSDDREHLFAVTFAAYSERVMEDGYRQKGMRRQLVEELRSKGITDKRVLEAIGSVPRHQFIDDSAFLQLAYTDKAFPIGCGQTISQPYTVAFQTQLLEVSAGMKVLEIGTGSGYQTAVLVAMGVKVFSIERQRPLYLRTREKLAAMKVKASLYYGDGYVGLPLEAPFDRVLVTCGAPYIPDALKQQLKPGGRAVIPVGEGAEQRMMLVERSSVEDERVTDHGSFRFVPMLEQRAN